MSAKHTLSMNLRHSRSLFFGISSRLRTDCCNRDPVKRDVYRIFLSYTHIVRKLVFTGGQPLPTFPDRQAFQLEETRELTIENWGLRRREIKFHLLSMPIPSQSALHCKHAPNSQVPSKKISPPISPHPEVGLDHVSLKFEGRND